MWFRKKHVNRRLDRRHVLLDVKLRTAEVRFTRMRWASIAIALTCSTVLGVFMVWRTGEWAMDHFLYENPDFAVKQIDVQTDGVISADQLRRWAGVKSGDNLLALDLNRVKRDLELVPQVKTAAIERVLPRTLRIRVEEREPLVQIYAPQLRADGRGYDMRLFQMDSEGMIMLPLQLRQRATSLERAGETLPTLSGLDSSELQPGRKLDATQLHAALDLIAAFDHSPMAGLADLRGIDISSPGILVVVTGQGGQVTFATQDFDQQLRRWRQIYDRGIQMNLSIAAIDLAVPNNIPVRWLDARAVVPPVPKQKTAVTNRKTNV